jgi:hypothetical protein
VRPGKSDAKDVLTSKSFGQKNFRRQLETIFGNEGWAAFEVQPTSSATIGAMALFAKASVFAHDVDVGGEKSDHVHLILN